LPLFDTEYAARLLHAVPNKASREWAHPAPATTFIAGEGDPSRGPPQCPPPAGIRESRRATNLLAGD